MHRSSASIFQGAIYRSDVALLRSLIEKPNHIRNVTLIGHIDHGKSTLADQLNLTNAFRISDSNEDQNDNNNNPSIGNSNILPFLFKLPADCSFPKEADGPEFLINMYLPGNLDYSLETTENLRVCDGSLTVIDVVEGVCVQTETQMRKSLMDRVVPVIAINKLDRAFLELQLSSEEIYQCLCRIIDNVNVIISTYHDESLGDIEIKPQRCNLVFTSGLHGWGFTLKQFAVMYADKFGVDEDKMIERLWGDNYFDSEAKKWTTNPVSSSGKTLSRAFCKFILDPIGQMINAVMNNQIDRVERMLKSLGIVLTAEEQQLTGKPLLKKIMNKWLPLNQAVLNTIVNQLPSPIQAQKYRTEILYTGPQDDITAEAIRQCDAKGPLMVYVCKMVPTSDRGRFYALGRVFSGTIHSGQTVRILGPDNLKYATFNINQHPKYDIFIKPVQRTLLPLGRTGIAVESIGAGTFCCLVGVDAYILKTASITTDPSSFPLLLSIPSRPVPAAQYSVEPENPADLPKLIEGLKYLQKWEMLLQVVIEETGELMISGDSQLQIEVSLKDIQEKFMPRGKIKLSGPVIAYKETVSSLSSQICMSKSPNKHNRLYVVAEPLAEGLPEALEKLDVSSINLNTPANSKLVHEWGWKEQDVKNIWCFGVDNVSLLVNNTNSVANITEIKDSVCAAFQWVTKEGVLATETVRGVRMNLVDAVLHSDAVHRGGGQIIPTARRAFYAAMLTAQPRLMEPVLSIDIQCAQTAVGGVYSVLIKRKAIIVEEIPRPGTPLITVRCYLPAHESPNFASDLRANTAGQAFPQMAFDHYQIIPDDPLVDGTRANDIVKSIRKRRGLSEELPTLDRFLDTL